MEEDHAVAEAWAHVEVAWKLAYEDILSECPEIDPALILGDAVGPDSKAIAIGTFPVNKGPSVEAGKNQKHSESMTQLRLAMGWRTQIGRRI